MIKYVCLTTCYWGPTVGTETVWMPGDVYEAPNAKMKVPEHFERISDPPAKETENEPGVPAETQPEDR